MTERSAGIFIAFASVALLAVACVATSPSPPATAVTPAPTTSPVSPATIPTSVRPSGPRPQLSDSARARRDSINAVRRDSLMNVVLLSIAGKENFPAESVFKNIKVLKGTTAGRLVRSMAGFSRSLGVSCGFCHTVGKYADDDKEEKQTARIMITMVAGINRDYLSKLPPDNGRTPTIGCLTCHRGMTRPGGDGPPASPRPGTD